MKELTDNFFLLIYGSVAAAFLVGTLVWKVSSDKKMARNKRQRELYGPQGFERRNQEAERSHQATHAGTAR